MKGRWRHEVSCVAMEVTECLDGKWVTHPAWPLTSKDLLRLSNCVGLCVEYSQGGLCFLALHRPLSVGIVVTACLRWVILIRRGYW